MVRESGISATKPVFPTYLLPSFKLPFRRRHSASSSSSDGDSPASSAATTPANSPPKDGHLNSSTQPRPSRLSRVGPDTIRCSTCSADIAFSSQIVSKGFTGRYGRAFLISPLPPPAEQTLLNIRLGRNEDRQLVTGWHTVADISCENCASKLGWKYVDARELSQKYKVGKFILETERVVTHRHWEDVQAEAESLEGAGARPSQDEVTFDSEDEEECDDIFAGVWDSETVAKRRSKTAAQRKAP